MTVMDVVITVDVVTGVPAAGGTGVTGRDVTPEAFERVLEKKIEHYRYLIEQGLDCDTP